MYCQQSLDLRSQVRLGIEPGSGDASTFRDGLEGDRLTRRVEGAEGLDGLGAGVLAAAPGGVNDVLAVFSSHRGLLRLSGGVFQNRLLLCRTADLLRDAGLRVLIPELLPANDGGISYGQLAVASARLERERGNGHVRA